HSGVEVVILVTGGALDAVDLRGDERGARPRSHDDPITGPLIPFRVADGETPLSVTTDRRDAGVVPNVKLMLLREGGQVTHVVVGVRVELLRIIPEERSPFL